MGGIRLAFIEIAPKEIADNPFKLIGSDWMLITAGDEEKCNTMTASWGGVGILWNKPVSFIFVSLPCRWIADCLSEVNRKI